MWRAGSQLSAGVSVLHSAELKMRMSAATDCKPAGAFNLSRSIVGSKICEYVSIRLYLPARYRTGKL